MGRSVNTSVLTSTKVLKKRMARDAEMTQILHYVARVMSPADPFEYVLCSYWVPISEGSLLSPTVVCVSALGESVL